jgi:cystathionine beta-synthase
MPIHTTAGRASPHSPAPVFASVLDMIGHTPMLELRRLDTGPCRLFGKMELMNPAGSIKDRIGLSMIEAAERDGRLNPKADPKPTIIEATAGNTGLALALVGKQRGYNIKFVMPDKMSQEKIQHLRAMGADVILTRSDVERGHPEYYQDVAAELARCTPNSLYVNQFGNPDNPQAHYDHTGPEIWAQCEAVGGVDAFVCGVGSGGTLSGVGKYLREKNPNVKLVLADPVGSILAPLVNENKKVKPGSWLVEGMGEDFIPDICDLSLVSEAVAVSDAQAFNAARELLAREGVLAGSSTGCILHGALDFCRRQSRPMNVVTLICDSGAKYLSKMFNDFWMMDNGFIRRDRRGDLRDLIARRHDFNEDYTLRPTDPVRNVVKRMGMYGVSQMVVVEEGKVVGLVDEGDVLLAITHEPGRPGTGSVGGEGSAFDRPVSDFMTRRLETVRPETPIDALMPIFRADRVAIVVDHDGTFYGLITKMDMINHLRTRLIR